MKLSWSYFLRMHCSHQQQQPWSQPDGDRQAAPDLIRAIRKGYPQIVASSPTRKPPSSLLGQDWISPY